MGGLLRPPIVCRVPTLKKKRLEPYSPKGYSDYFYANKSPTKSPTRWTNSAKRRILGVSMRKESNKWQRERLILALMKMFIKNL